LINGITIADHLYFNLICELQTKGRRFYPTHEAAAEKLGVSRATIIKTVANLLKYGILGEGPRCGRSKEFFIHPLESWEFLVPILQKKVEESEKEFPFLTWFLKQNEGVTDNLSLKFSPEKVKAVKKTKRAFKSMESQEPQEELPEFEFPAERVKTERVKKTPSDARVLKDIRIATEALARLLQELKSES
jgi:hypothetical protein